MGRYVPLGDDVAVIVGSAYAAEGTPKGVALNGRPAGVRRSLLSRPYRKR